MSASTSAIASPSTGVFVVISAVHLTVIAAIAIYLNFGGR